MKLTRPFTKKGIPADYWLLLSLVRNGELYTRKEMIEATNIRAVRTLFEAGLISRIRYTNLFAITAEGLAFFKFFKPAGTLKRIPKTVNVWKTKITRSNGDSVTAEFDSIKDAKNAARLVIDSEDIKHINIIPAAF